MTIPTNNFFLTTIVIALFISNPMQAQHDLTKNNQASIYICYRSVGLGANQFESEPKIILTGDKFTFSYKLTYLTKKLKKSTEISTGKFRQSSIDSIVGLVKNLKDSLIYKTNPCVMSGGIDYLTVAFGTDTTKFALWNTADYTALNLIDIINLYLPRDKRIYLDTNAIENENSCWKWLQEEIRTKKSRKDSTTKNGT